MLEILRVTIIAPSKHKQYKIFLISECIIDCINPGHTPPIVPRDIVKHPSITLDRFLCGLLTEFWTDVFH